MRGPQTVAVAVRALMRNKLRTFLTTLGIVVGVAAVISMGAIGSGAKRRIDQTFESMGTNMLVVHSGSSRSGGMRGGSGSQPTLTWEDLERVRNDLPGIRYTAPVLGAPAQVLSEGQNWATNVQGSTPDFPAIRNWPAARGRWYSDEDVAAAAKVAVLGKTVVDNLYGAGADPVGRLIRINRVPFSVIGVAAGKGRTPMGGDNDDAVFVPVTTFRSRLQGGLQQYIAGAVLVSAWSQAQTADVQAAIERLLRARHRIKPGEEDDFTVRNLSDFAAAQQEGAQTMTSLLAGIALVSLLVGGIGIMNIMLVSVTERTREIGLRMAVGARPSAILLQFLVESIVLTVAGGLIGVALGAGVACWLSARFEWPLLIEPAFPAMAVLFSGLVGIGFGFYPAWKASRLDPIEALRHE